MKGRFLALIMVLLLIPVSGFTAQKKKTPASRPAKPAAVQSAEKKTEAREQKKGPFTQKDFAVMLVEQLGWTGGLPKEPKERDYLVILDGKRTFKYEAEASYNPVTDGVVLRQFNLYGPFTGTGWLSGVTSPVNINLSLHLPIEGTYEVLGSVGSDRPGDYIFSFGERKLVLKADPGMKERSAGMIQLPAGKQLIKVQIPPMGAVDSITLSADDHKAIQPFRGWRFKDVMTQGQLSEVGVVLMNALDRLPPSGAPVQTVSAAEVVEPGTSLSKTNIDYLGEFKSKEWLRADHRGDTVKIPIKVQETGYYDMNARVMGKLISGEIKGARISVPGNEYLSVIGLGLHRLEAGVNMLTLKLPPGGGIDELEISRRKSETADFMAIAGFSGDPAAPVSREATQAFIDKIKSSHTIRK